MNDNLYHSINIRYCRNHIWNEWLQLQRNFYGVRSKSSITKQHSPKKLSLLNATALFIFLLSSCCEKTRQVRYLLNLWLPAAVNYLLTRPTYFWFVCQRNCQNIWWLACRLFLAGDQTSAINTTHHYTSSHVPQHHQELHVSKQASLWQANLRTFLMLCYKSDCFIISRVAIVNT